MAKKRVVAIDIGTHTAKMVQLEQSSGTLRLTPMQGSLHTLTRMISNRWLNR